MPEKEHSELSDGDIFEYMLNGDEEAWEVFVERFSRLLHTVPFRYFGSDGVREDVEDIVQMTWLNLVEHLENIKEPDRLQAWLVTTSRRNCTNITGAKRWNSEVPLYVNEDGDPYKSELVPSVEEKLIGSEESQRIFEGLLELDGRDQLLIYFLFFDPSSPEHLEIAGELGMALGSMGPSRMRCLERLRGIFFKSGGNWLKEEFLDTS